ncbi:MAG: hypothetical protein JO214_19540 [Frankiaceae bacterium]|nr:hypothetical protein [Frankiaceae bacterium]
MTSRRPLLLSATVVAAGFALGACSSSGSNPAAGPGTSPNPRPSTPSSSSPHRVRSQAPVPAENNPPGDIPDNLAFVAYRDRGGRFRFTHPEGWAQRRQSGGVVFTDKLNGVQVTAGTQSTPPSPATARQQDVPALQRTQPAFQLRSISAVSEPAGRGVLIVYRRNSAPDPVTGRRYRDEVQRYELVSGGHSVVMELFGPVGADNVDAYRTMISSLRQR